VVVIKRKEGSDGIHKSLGMFEEGGKRGGVRHSNKEEGERPPTFKAHPDHEKKKLGKKSERSLGGEFRLRGSRFGNKI